MIMKTLQLTVYKIKQRKSKRTEYRQAVGQFQVAYYICN